MEWKVKNALSRDVEREHLNKILKEIQAAVSSSSSGGGLTEQQVIALIQRHAGGGSSSPTRITLSGDVTGSGTSSIPTTINPALLGIGEAPVDSLSYWRSGGQWQAVPGTITSLNNVFGDGIVVHLDDEGWVLREIKGTANQIVVADGDGTGNPTISLHPDVVSELAEALSYSDLKDSLVAGVNITLVPDDLLKTITINATGGGGGGGGVDTVTGGSGITVDNTDSSNPVVHANTAVLTGVASRTLTASASIFGGRAVVVESSTIRHPLSINLDDGSKIVGIARQSGAASSSLLVQTDGPVTEGSWAWVPGPVFVTNDGVLSQTAPASGWVVSIGTAVNSTTIELDVSLPILRS